MRHVVVALLALALLGPISPSWADSTSCSSTPAQVGYGAGSFLGTLDHVAPTAFHAGDLGTGGAGGPPPPPGQAFVVFAGQSNMGGLNQSAATLPASWQKFIGDTPADQAAAAR